VLSVFGRRIKGMIRLRPEQKRTCNVTYRDGVDVIRNRVTYKSWLHSNVTGLFGALLVFGRCIKRMIRLRPEQVWTCYVVTLPRIVTPYRDSVDGTRDRVMYQKLVTR
jgi:hypothetical protein